MKKLGLSLRSCFLATKGGFTLIELLVVITIIAVLASLSVVGLNSIRSKSRDTKRVGDIRQVQVALEMYKNDNNVYPSAITAGNAIVGPDGQTYMAKVPAPPNKADGTCATDPYTYSSVSPYSVYTITYCLGGTTGNLIGGNCQAVPGNICSVPIYNTGATNPGTMADDASVGSRTWTNYTYATSSNDSYATFSAPAYAAFSHYLKATNFGFSIPAGATIDGILVEIEKSLNQAPTVNDYAVDNAVKIVKSDTTIGTMNKADTTTYWPETDAYASYGSSSDLWSETWTATDINDPDFGVVIQGKLFDDLDNSPIGRVDHIRITVYYTN